MTKEQVVAVIRKHGYTLTAVAEKIGLSRQALNGQLKREKFSIKTLEDIAKALNISIAEFYNEEMALLIYDLDRYKEKIALLEETLKAKEEIIELLKEEVKRVKK